MFSFHFPFIPCCIFSGGVFFVLHFLHVAFSPPTKIALPFYLKVSKSILCEVHCGALTHLKNGLANVLNKTAERVSKQRVTLRPFAKLFIQSNTRTYMYLKIASLKTRINLRDRGINDSGKNKRRLCKT